MMILAVDPGVGGGAVLGCTDSVELHPWRTEADFLDLVGDLLPTEAVAVVEEVPAFVRAIPASASFKLAYNYGFCVGALRAHGFPVNLVRPQVWQKGLSGLKGLQGAPRKRKLRDHAVRLHPDLKVTLAVADAVLIMDHWGRTMFHPPFSSLPERG